MSARGRGALQNETIYLNCYEEKKSKQVIDAAIPFSNSMAERVLCMAVWFSQLLPCLV